MSDLQSFHLFPKLPYELRLQIWLLLLPRNQIVFVDEIQHYSYDQCQYAGDDRQGDENESENDRILRQLEIELDNGASKKPEMSWYLTIEPEPHIQQLQLEHFNFTSSRPQPILPTLAEIEEEKWSWWDRNRVNHFDALQRKTSVLLHVSQETRQLVQRYGCALAFSSRTHDHKIWFNFSDDYLHLDCGYEREDCSTSIDGGRWNLLGQLIPTERILLKKLSLEFEHHGYQYGGEVPFNLHMAVQLCGSLVEVLLVERVSRQLYPHPSVGSVPVDVTVEDLVGHIYGWSAQRILELERDRNFRKFDERYVRDTVDPLGAVCRDVERQLRDHEPLLPQEDGSPNRWTTPKIRFVMLVSPREADGMTASRRYFRADIEQWLQDPTSTNVPPQSTHDGLTFRSLRNYYRSRPPTWLKEAKAMVHANFGWPPPNTIDFEEAERAVVEMDFARMQLHGFIDSYFQYSQSW